MFYIGPHVSIRENISFAPSRAKEKGATGFALFTKNQRQWNAPPLKSEDTNAFKEEMQNLGYCKEAILPHDSYLINLGTPDEEKRQKSLTAFIDEMERVKALGLKYLNFHPGSHTGLCSKEDSIAIIAACLDEAIERVEGVMPVLEITAGAGSNMGSAIEELSSIIKHSSYPDQLGVCIDTCHAHQAGYDLSSIAKADAFFSRLDELLPGKLRGMHLNDSKAVAGKHPDRHESLGRGTIGWDTFLYIASDKRFENIPLILETPDESLWEEEIRRLRNA